MENVKTIVVLGNTLFERQLWNVNKFSVNTAKK